MLYDEMCKKGNRGLFGNYDFSCDYRGHLMNEVRLLW